MILAMDEMDVQGVSTRKVTAIVEEPCGLEGTATQTSLPRPSGDGRTSSIATQRPPRNSQPVSRPPPRSADRAPDPCRSPAAAPHHQQPRAAQQGDQKTQPRRNTLPNEASLLRLASAGLAQISDDWETDRAYPTREPDDPPLKTAICRTGVAGVVCPPWPPRETGMSARRGWRCQPRFWDGWQSIAAGKGKGSAASCSFTPSAWP